MAFDITILHSAGLSESELLSMRASLVESLTSGQGGVITQTSTRDLTVSFSGNSAKPEELLAAVNYALQKLDPDTYGDSNTRQKRKFVQ